MDDGDARGRRRRRRRRTVGGMIDVAGAYPVLLERGELTRPRRGEGDADLLVSAGGSGVGREVSLGVRVRSARGWGGVRARSGGAMGRGRARARRAGKQRGNARRAGVWRTSARASLGWGTRGNRTRRRLRDRGGARGASGGDASRWEGRGVPREGRGRASGRPRKKCNTLLNTRMARTFPVASVRDVHPRGGLGRLRGYGRHHRVLVRRRGAPLRRERHLDHHAPGVAARVVRERRIADGRPRAVSELAVVHRSQQVHLAIRRRRVWVPRHLDGRERLLVARRGHLSPRARDSAARRHH